MSNPEIARLAPLASERYAAGDLAQSEAVCKRILQLNPREAPALVLLGQIAQVREQFDLAASYYQRFLTQRPKLAQGHVFLGSVLIRQRRFREAMSRFDRALKLQPDLLAAQTGRARVFLARGEYADARAALQPHVEGGRHDIWSVLILAETELSDGQPDRVVELSAKYVDDDRQPVEARYMLGCIVGKALERRGEHDEAFRRFRIANDLMPHSFRRDTYTASVDQIIAAYDNPDSLPRGTSDSEKPVFIVGMMRSGSTLIERIIDAHPRGFGAGEVTTLPDLMHAFKTEHGSLLTAQQDIASVTSDDLDAIARDYLKTLSRHGRRAERIVDKHLINYAQLGFISRAFPKARIIHCQRDPVDVCLSTYTEPLPVAMQPHVNDLRALAVVYQQYDRLMSFWRERLDLNMLEVRYEDLVADPEPSIRAIIEFVGLLWDDACLRSHETSTSSMTLSHAQVRQPMYRSSVRRSDRFGAHLDPLRAALGDSATTASRAD